MSRPIPPSYKTRNLQAHNEALKQRGSLKIWFDPDLVWVPPPTGKRGRQSQYSDAAIQTCLTMKVLFGMALRQTTGFVESFLRLVDLDWAVPDFQHVEPAPEGRGLDHSLPRLAGAAEPADRRHRHQGRR